MSGTTGLSPIDLYVNYAAHETNLAAASLKGNPQASALIANFKKEAPGITTADALLKNYKVLSVVLGAFNLQGSINNTAILRTLLTQDPKASNSLAQRLGNPQYQLFAQALSNFKPPPFASAAGINQIVSSYTTNIFEQQADQQAPGLANALKFTREASSLKSLAAVQSDAGLLSVAVTGLNLPLQNFQQVSFEQQTSLLKSKLNPANLQKPAYVTHLVESYLVQQQSAADAAPPAGSLASLFSDGSDTTGDSLISILNPSPTVSGGAGDSSSGVLSLFA